MFILALSRLTASLPKKALSG